MQHTNFKGRVFMTHPTKAIFRWLLGDFMRVSNVPENYQPLYTQEDLEASFDRIETIDYHSTMEIEGIKFTAYHAGHVLGAAMYFIEIGGVKVLFTGDYSREEDRHLNQAEIPAQKPDILITESTYGTGIHQPRLEKEARLMSLINSTVTKGGRCLLPVFALGRAQEILLILDEYWDSHPELQDVNIYYVSSLAKKCMAVYQTYINMMNENIRKKFRDSRTNPFQFKHIRSVRNLERFDDIGPCVMVATPGMLQSGVSRELLERWAPDSKNSLLVTGYSVEGTMAKQMLTEPPEIGSVNNPEVKIPRRMAVEELSFAAHVDFKENSRFIDLINAPHIILVHGEGNNMGRLKSALLSKYSDRKGTEREVKIYNPKNCYEVELPFKSLKVARTMGDLASEPPYDGQIVSGVLVEKDFHLNLLHVSDLREYATLTTSVVTERQSVIVDAGPELIRYHLEQMFGAVEVLAGAAADIKVEPDKEELDKDEPEEITSEFLIMGAVKVIHKGNLSTIEWVGNVMNDAIADSILAVLLSVDVSPASVKLSSTNCNHDHHHHGGITRTKIDQICALLKAQFGDCLTTSPDYKTAKIEIEGVTAEVEFKTLTVTCSSPALEKRVAAVLERAVNTAAPLAQDASRLVEIKEEDDNVIPLEIKVE